MHTRSMFASWCLLVAVLASPSVSAAKHDVDGDGRDDVFWRNGRTGANVLWLAGDPARQRSVLGVTNTRWAVVGFGDFDGDGFADLLWRQRTTGVNVIWRSANAATQQAVAAVPNLDWYVAGVGDFNRDARSDILWRNRRTGANVVWLSAQATTTRTLTPVSASAAVAGIGDFDGDGGDDIAWRNIATGVNALWLSNGGRVALAGVGDVAWQVAGVGDFDGDGRADLLWHIWDGRSRIWRSGQASMLLAVDSTVWSRDVAAIGDFDGDGRADVFWRDYELGGNDVWLSANAATARKLAGVANKWWAIAPYEAQATMPMVTFDNITVTEGNGGATPVTFYAHLAHPSVLPARVQMQFDDGYGVTGALHHGDFEAPQAIQDVAIPAGEDSGSFQFSVTGDTTPETNEVVNAFVSEILGVWIVNQPSIVISNDDANTVWLDDLATVEGNAGMHPMTFTVQLSRPQATPVRFDIATRDIRAFLAAKAGEDYLANSASGVVIPAGATSATFVVQIIDDQTGDNFVEPFEVIVSNVVGAMLIGMPARGYIYDYQEGGGS